MADDGLGWWMALWNAPVNGLIALAFVVFGDGNKVKRFVPAMAVLLVSQECAVVIRMNSQRQGK